MTQIYVVSVGRNNLPWIRWHLAGLDGQDDPAASMFLVDDCSDDGTAREALHIRGESGTMSLDVTRTTERRGGLVNLRSAALDLPDDAVVIHWDTDDFFAGPNVISRIRREYDEHPEALMTYGSHRHWPTFKEGLPPGGYSHFRVDWSPRTANWLCEPPRSFRVKLLRAIPTDYLQDEHGAFYDCAYDFALYMAMMELAGPDRCRYIPDVLYLYNITNPGSDFRVRPARQRMNAERIRAMKPLERLP